MYPIVILLCVVALSANPAAGQTKSSSTTDVSMIQEAPGKSKMPPAIGRGTPQDTANTDTTSLRSRRLRAPRAPRPGIFTSLDSAKTMPDSVIYLSVRGKGLTSLAGIGAFKNMQALDVAGNNLAAFPAEVLKLPNLVSLDLSDNPIKAVPQEIGSLTGLARLSLRNTAITTLPASVGSLQNLMTLDVAKNPLVSLPIKELNQLPRLKTISIGQLPQREETEPAPAEQPKPVTPEKK